jgi:hydrogenase-4 membrane subunit HyfE
MAKTLAPAILPAAGLSVSSDRSLQAERLFYVLAAGAVASVSAVGFRNFYLQGKGFGGNPLTEQIVPLILVHALAMSCWVILFCVQSALILAGNRRLHMVLGPIGAGLAVAIVFLGSAMAILSAHFNPRAYEMFGGPRFFLVEMLTEILLFGALVGIAVAQRRRAEIHRPMMLLATVVILSGALARCPIVCDLAATPPLYAYAPVLIFGALLFFMQWVMTRRANRWYLLGYVAVTAAFLLSMPLGRSSLWKQIVGGFIE